MNVFVSACDLFRSTELKDNRRCINMILLTKQYHRMGVVPMNAKNSQMVSDFWRTIPFEEQLEQQGVSAAADLDEICALWPADDDPDKLLRHILRERRRVAKRPLGRFGYRRKHISRPRSPE